MSNRGRLCYARSSQGDPTARHHKGYIAAVARGSHVGEVRVTVAPDFRRQGLATLLVRELCDIADDAELERVLFEAVADKEEDAIQTMGPWAS